MSQDFRDWLRDRRPDWDVAHIFDVGLKGRPDPEIFAWARDNGYLVITFDKVFPGGWNVPFPPHFGIIRLRGSLTTLDVAREQLERLFGEIEDSELPGSMVIVGPSRNPRHPRTVATN